MKKNFFTGLLILFPFTMTLIIVVFVVNFFTSPFQGIVENILTHYGFFSNTQGFLSSPQALHIISKLLVLIALIIITIIIGFLGRLMVIRSLFHFGDKVIHRIPLINKLYKASQDVVHTLFNTKGTSFSQVVLVPFPNSKAYSIGFITQQQKSSGAKDRLSIFVPGTPNPTMGFMLVYRYEEVIFTEMKVEEALKFVVSCGIMTPDFQISGKNKSQ